MRFGDSHRLGLSMQGVTEPVGGVRGRHDVASSRLVSAAIPRDACDFTAPGADPERLGDLCLGEIQVVPQDQDLALSPRKLGHTVEHRSVLLALEDRRLRRRRRQQVGHGAEPRRSPTAQPVPRAVRDGRPGGRTARGPGRGATPSGGAAGRTRPGRRPPPSRCRRREGAPAARATPSDHGRARSPRRRARAAVRRRARRARPAPALPCSQPERHPGRPGVYLPAA